MSFILKWWKQFCYNRIASIIDAAALSDTYKRYHYLCPAIGLRSINPFRRMAIRHIERVIGTNMTLHAHILLRLDAIGYSREDWAYFNTLPWERELIVCQKFWFRMTDELRDGNPLWGRWVHPREIHADPPHLHDVYDPTQPGSKADQILNQLKADNE